MSCTGRSGTHCIWRRSDVIIHPCAWNPTCRRRLSLCLFSLSLPSWKGLSPRVRFLNLSSLTHMAAAAGTHVPPSGQKRRKEKQKKADDSAHAQMTDATTRSKPSSSALFVPFRALGLISDGVAFALQRRGKETFLVTSVGTSWQVRFLILFTCLPSRCVHSTHPSSASSPAQIYNAASLRLRLIGPDVTRVLPSRHARPDASASVDDARIAALACAGDLTFAAVGDCVVECRRVHRTGVYRVSSNSTSSASSVLTQLLVLGGGY